MILFTAAKTYRSLIRLLATILFIAWVPIQMVFAASALHEQSQEELSLEGIYQKLDVNPAGTAAKEIENAYNAYAKHRKHKALALALSDNDYSIGYSYKAPSELSASQTAMAKCEEWRTDNNNGGQCEILLLGDTFVSPGAIIKKDIDDETPAMAWRVDGPNSTLYLIGTLHVLKPSLLPLPRVFDLAFSQADRIVFEMNPILSTDPERIRSLQALMIVDPKEQKSQYDKATRKLLKRFTRDQAIPEASAYTVPAVINAIQVSQIKMAALGYTFNTGVEMHYAREASKAGKAILEFEGSTDALQPLLDLPMETQLLMLRESIQQVDMIPLSLEALLNSWLVGDATRLYAESFHNIALNPALETLATQLLDDRNQAWMEKINALLQEPSNTAIMVGAGHFGGENGLLSRLKKQGLNPIQLSWGGGDVTESQDMDPSIAGIRTSD